MLDGDGVEHLSVLEIHGLLRFGESCEALVEFGYASFDGGECVFAVGAFGLGVERGGFAERCGEVDTSGVVVGFFSQFHVGVGHLAVFAGLAFGCVGVGADIEVEGLCGVEAGEGVFDELFFLVIHAVVEHEVDRGVGAGGLILFVYGGREYGAGHERGLDKARFVGGLADVVGDVGAFHAVGGVFYRSFYLAVGDDVEVGGSGVVAHGFSPETTVVGGIVPVESEISGGSESVEVFGKVAFLFSACETPFVEFHIQFRASLGCERAAYVAVVFTGHCGYYFLIIVRHACESELGGEALHVDVDGGAACGVFGLVLEVGGL